MHPILDQLDAPRAAGLANLGQNVRGLLALGLEQLDPQDWRDQQRRAAVLAVIDTLELGVGALRKHFGAALGQQGGGTARRPLTGDEALAARFRLVAAEQEGGVSDEAAAGVGLGEALRLARDVAAGAEQLRRYQAEPGRRERGRPCDPGGHDGDGWGAGARCRRCGWRIMALLARVEQVRRGSISVHLSRGARARTMPA